MNIVIVNDKDEEIGVKSREERLASDISRVSGLIIFNPKGEVLIAQRAFNKKNSPGKWDLAVAGTIEEGETYISNIVKEAQEEVGLIVREEDLSIKAHIYWEIPHKYFATVFEVTIEDKPIKDFVIQKEEVAAVQWISKEKLAEWFRKFPDDFIPCFQEVLKIIIINN